MLRLLARRKTKRVEPSSYQAQNSDGCDPTRLIEMDRKIHPNLNLLAEELSSSQGHERQSHSESIKKKHSESPDIGMADFIGLTPSARRPPWQKEVYTRDNNGRKAYQNFQRSRSVEEGADDHQEGTAIEESINESIRCPTIAEKRDEEQGEAKDSIPGVQLIRRTTFGKRIDPQSTSHPHNETQIRSGSTSQSSLSRSQRFSSPQSYMACSNSQPQTPRSETRSSQSFTPQSIDRSARAPGPTLPSPNIFGVRLPARNPPKSGDSYFDFKDIPPPLPPLDHPAFQESSRTGRVSSGIKHSFPVGSKAYGVHGNSMDFARIATHSLPSLTYARSSSRDRHLTEEQKRHTRTRSKSNIGYRRQDKTFDAASARKLHSRSQSQSSIASSRRSSAEYSAKQVSSIGHSITSAHEGCWEVEVSKAIVNLALGKEEVQSVNNLNKTRLPPQDANASAFGKARGNNRTPGGDSLLGSPFLLQELCPGDFTDRKSSNDRTTRITPNLVPQTSHREGGRDLRNDDMSNGDPITQPVGSSRTHTAGRGVGASGGAYNTHPSARPRSRGGRALSTPSTSETPSLSAMTLDTNQILSSLGPSTLHPPSVSVIAPTPVPSPISPTRRAHHKSTPTIPTSVLKNASMPPVIEKSHSSGSGKRKAEEAGVGGDKTPPKQAKEPRATFAPEPRTHRASGNSGTSTHAPSSFNRSKRVRLTESSEGRGSQHSVSRAGNLPTPDDSPPNAKSTGSWSSKGSHRVSASSHKYGPPPVPSASHPSHYSGSEQQNRPPSRRSLSQASIPLSALISPHAPSIIRPGTFHMRDPRKPNPVQRTPWSLSLPSHVQSDESRWSSREWVERGGSPVHAWLFFIGFILFPIWWIAALFIPIPRTRRLGESGDAEKGVVLDDPQVEHDAKSWRTRCRVMATVSLITYVPFIVLVAIFT